MVGVGVIGVGEWGKNHVRVLTELPHTDLVQVCDISGSRCRMIERSFGVDTTEDMDSLLSRSDIDAVCVCTPAATHADVARAVLEAGKHLLVEKPFALNSPACEDLMKIARKDGLTLQVGHIFRFDPSVMALKREIDSDTFGKIYMLHCSRIGFRTPRLDCGVIFDFAVHDFDTVCLLLGATPIEISATSSSVLPQTPFEDVAFITLRFPDNILANITVSWLTPRKVREMWLVGEARSAQLDSITPQLNVFDFDYLAFLESNGYRYDSYGAFRAMRRMGNVSQPFIDQHEPLRLEIEHFLDCVRTGETPRTSGEVGVQSVRMAEAALRSAEDRAPVPFP